MNETWQTILSSHRRKSRLYQHYRILFHSHAADPKLVFLASDPLNSVMPSALSFRITLDSNALARLLPPPAARAWSCVYVLRRGDGWAYCGESDDLSGRLASHRANAAREGSSDVECTFITVPREDGGKSRARALESRVIRKLRAEGIPLLSGSDARNTSFGSAA